MIAHILAAEVDGACQHTPVTLTKSGLELPGLSTQDGRGGGWKTEHEMQKQIEKIKKIYLPFMIQPLAGNQ